MITATADDIRRAAQHLFATNGFEATTMREIAAAVGIRAASLYNHFKSKEDILWDLTATALSDLESSQSEALAAIPESAEPAQQLRAFVVAHVVFHAVNSEKAALVNREMGGLSRAHLRRAVTLRDRYEGHLREIIRNGVARKEFRVPDERVTSFAILQMGIAVSTWYRAGGGMTPAQLGHLHAELATRMVAA